MNLTSRDSVTGHPVIRRVLVIRPDRLGDTLLSLPVLATLRESNPGLEIFFLTSYLHQSLYEPLMQDPKTGLGKWVGYQVEDGILSLSRRIRSLAPDAAIALQDSRVTTWALARAGVPTRIGPISTLRSRWVFNFGVRQKRSESQKHEAEYGVDLLAPLGIASSRVMTKAEDTSFQKVSHLSPPFRSLKEAYRKTPGYAAFKRRAPISPHLPLSGYRIAIHPGMGGSALNIEPSVYHDLSKRIIAEGGELVLTFGPTEVGLRRSFEKALSSALIEGNSEVSQVCFFGGMAPSPGPALDPSGTSVLELAKLYASCGLVVAPSTGPLHLAGAVGTAVLGIYPPILVQSGRRWGPLYGGAYIDPVQVHPDTVCNAKYHCLGKKCPYLNCMENMTSEIILQRIKESFEK